jgi:hypothetical protein
MNTLHHTELTAPLMQGTMKDDREDTLPDSGIHLTVCMYIKSRP